MNKMLRTALGAVACTVLVMVPAVAATQSSATETHKTTAIRGIPSAWPAESLTGTIVSVDPQNRLMIVKDSSGVPFDMVIGHNARIKAGDREIKLGDLPSDVNKKASIRFVPERRGDVVESIQMNG